MTLIATTESSIVITAPSRVRPAQRSSEKKYGRASRQMMASVERRRDTGLLLSAGSGSKLRSWVVAQADQFGLNWAIIPFAGGSRGSDPVAAMLDFSIRPRPKLIPAPAEVCRCNRSTGPLRPAIVDFGRVRRPVSRGRDNSSLVWGGITPYNLP